MNEVTSRRANNCVELLTIDYYRLFLNMMIGLLYASH